MSEPGSCPIWGMTLVDGGDHELWRHVEGEVGYEPDVPAHLAFDHDTALLYGADTANDLVFALDTTSGEPGGQVGRNHDADVQIAYEDADPWTVIEGAEHGLEKPSGLELVDWFDTELPEGSLMGIAFDGDGLLNAVDAVGDRVLRYAPVG